MLGKLMMLLAFVGGIACASPVAAPASPPRARAVAAPAPGVVVESAPSAGTLDQTLSGADQAYASRLSATRAGQFEVDRQVSALEQAIVLYTQFLDRAEGRPELEAAIKKSRERIADCRATIEFLLASSNAEGEPPPGPRQ